MDQLVEDPTSLFNEVFVHLEKAQEQAPLNEELLRRAWRNVDSHTPRATLWQLLNVGEQTLQSVQQDPRPLTRLLEQVVRCLPFNELKERITTEKLEQGLQSPSASIQLLILAYLHKAADTPSGAAFVAYSASLTKVLITTWLASESTEVADKSVEALIALLLVDSPSTSTFITSQPTSGEAQGQGLLWQRMFSDPDVYELLYSWTSLTNSKHNVSTKKGLQQATISQGRLFDFIARAAPISWTDVSTSRLPDIERKYIKSNATDQPYGGLLRYVASDMIDPSDFLMEMLRQDCFAKLLVAVQESRPQAVTPRMLEAMRSDAGEEANGVPNGDGVHL